MGQKKAREALKSQERASAWNTIRFITLIPAFFLMLDIFPQTLLGKSELTQIHNSWFSLLLPVLVFIEGAQLQGQHWEKQTEKKMIQFCAFRYLLPYAVLSVITLLLQIISFLRMNGENGNGTEYKKEIIGHIWDTISFYGIGELWILPVLFVCIVCYGLLRKDLKYPICLAITIVLAVVAYFSRGIGDFFDGTMSIKVFLLKFAFVAWRSGLLMVFVAFGDGAEQLWTKYRGSKLALGILGILALFIGVCITTYHGAEAQTEGTAISVICVTSADILDLSQNCIPYPFAFYPGALLLSIGFYLLGGWIGQSGIAEYLGRNWYLLLTCYGNFYFRSLAQSAYQKVLDGFANRFMASVSGIAILLACCGVMVAVKELLVKINRPEIKFETKKT